MKSLALLLALSSPLWSKTVETYKDPRQPVEARLEDLLSKMTLEEKAKLTAGLDHMATHPIPRLGIPSLKMTDGPNGVRWGKTTAFPTGIVMAASFDEPMIRRVGAALAREAKGRGRNVLLGPCVNMLRHPYGGRSFEGFGEDPILAGRLAVAWIQGLQENGVGASLKHYAANNQETRRFTIDTVVSEQVLREYYLPHFEMAVKEAKPLTVMAAYNRVNGPYSSASPWLLNGVLKKEWGFEGLVVSDWGATHEGAGALAAGLDLEMPGPGEFLGERIAAAVKKGELKEEALTEAARRILRVAFKLGLFEKQTVENEKEVNRKETQALARELAEDGSVLLKNDGAFLPLDLSKLRKVAVIGPSAAKARVGGGGSSQIDPPYSVSPLDGLKLALKGKAEVSYAPGVSLDDEITPLPAEAYARLDAEYFNNQEMKGAPVLKRAEKQLHYDWGKGSPHASVNKDHFSARWKGEFIGPEDATYKLGVRGDDGYRLFVDGKLIVENWNDHAATTSAAPFVMAKGKKYAFVVEFYENIGESSVTLGWKPVRNLVGEAVAAAKAADAVLLFVGLSSDYESEGFDRTQWGLPGGQEELIAAVAAANPKTAVVLLCGSPVDVEPWLAKVPSVLIAWFPGLEGGNALANLITGKANPSGRLPMTWPKKLQDLSTNKNFPGDEKQVRYEEGLMVGYRHFDASKTEPRWPFGHGLSYTSFEYSSLSVAQEGKGARVKFTVKNSGTREGAEAAQVYVARKQAPKGEPVQELQAFTKLKLKPGESREASLLLSERAFSRWDPKAKEWRYNGRAQEIRVGASSRDVKLHAIFDMK